jgi:hypothetical protein
LLGFMAERQEHTAFTARSMKSEEAARSFY